MQGPALRATGRNTHSDAQWSAPLGRATEASAGTVHEKMETPLSDAQWFVLLGRTTEASAGTVHEQMETPFSDAQWFVPLGRATEISACTMHEKMETPLSDAMVFVLLVSLLLGKTDASRETLRFCCGIKLWFGSEPVSSRSAMRKQLSIGNAGGPAVLCF